MIRRTLAVVLLLAAAGPARGFELLRVRNGPCAHNEQKLFWRPPTVPVSVTPLPAQYRELAIQAWQRWNLSIRSFTFTAGNAPACVQDGIAAMAIAPEACGQGDFKGALAITRSVWRSSGELVDADITFQSDTPLLGRDDLFRQVAMHELGHVLGLAHSDECGRSGAGTLMKTFLNFADPVLEAPQADDVSGAVAIYGGSGGGGSGGTPEGANSCAIVAPRRGDGTLLAWLAPFAVFLIGRLRHRRN